MEEIKLSVISQGFAEVLVEFLARGQSIKSVASGFSMLPFMRDGDSISLSGLNKEDIPVGSVIIFINPEDRKLIVHRVIEKNKGNFVTKGDSAPNSDGLIPKENILGIVSKIERKGKKISFGLGRERILISFLSRYGIIYFLLRVHRLLFKH